ncbi:MAG: twin-arginine translocase TatA/TatE family subunit [Bacteroidota bacterium]
MTSMLLFGLGMYEIMLVFAVVLLLFGGKKIPELMRGLGKGIREFNSAKASIESEIKEGMREADRQQLKEKNKES